MSFESFEPSFSQEGKLLHDASIATLRKYAHETHSSDFLERIHSVLLEKTFKDPDNEELQNLLMFAYLRLETFSQWDELIQRAS